MLVFKMKKRTLNKWRSQKCCWCSMDSVFGSDLTPGLRKVPVLCLPPQGSHSSSSLSHVGRNAIACCFLSSLCKTLPVPGDTRNICLDVFSAVASNLWFLRQKDWLHLGFGCHGAKPGGSNFTEFGLGRHQQKHSQLLPWEWVPAAKEQMTPENVGRVRGFVEDSSKREKMAVGSNGSWSDLKG